MPRITRSPLARERAGWTSAWLPFASAGLAVLLLAAAATWILVGRLEPAPKAGPKLGPAKVERAQTGDRVTRGQRVYLTHCASCHGPDGHGDGASAAALNPPPRDFAESSWKFGASVVAIRRVVADGVRGTAMPAYAQALSTGDLDAVVAFVRTLAPEDAGPEAMPARLANLLTSAGFTPADALRPALPFEVRDAGGAPHSLDTLRGQAVLVAFWGMDCPHCLKRFSSLERLATQYRDRGLTVLPICADETDPAETSTVARRHVKSLAVFADPSALTPRRYEVQVLPTAVLIDRQGRLLGRAEGAIDWSLPAIAELLNAILAPAGFDR